MHRGYRMAKIDGMYMTLSDDVLAALSKNGDENAFNELVIRYLGTLRFIARKYSAQGYEQNDFLQEGLTALFIACQSFDPNGGSAFGTYVSTIARRRFGKIISRLQSKKAVPESAVTFIEDVPESSDRYVPSPEEQLLRRERLEQMLDRLKALLSAREYEVLMLFASGLSYSMISQKLNISEKSVDNALQRARRKVGKNEMS